MANPLVDALLNRAVTKNRVRAWSGVDKRHNMSLPPEVRNATENELLDHYSVGADLGPIAGPVLGVAQEAIGRPLLAHYPDLANRLAPSVFNFKTENNNRPGAIDPYKKPTITDAATNLMATLSGSLDQYPSVQNALGLTLERSLGENQAQSDPMLTKALMKKIIRKPSARQ